jgi:NAD dependent epimerase/dehydratase
MNREIESMSQERKSIRQDSWKGKKVLVTGAGGFIASHLVERLLSERARVRAFVRYNSRHDAGFLREVEAREGLEITAGDLRNPGMVERVVEGMEVVFHLGAVISIPYSYVNPAEVVDSNITGTLNVLMACRKWGVQRIVHTSTSEVYGTAIVVPIDESHPLQGQSPYSASKIGADKLAESFWRAFGLPVTTVRPFNTYGPRQSARAVIPTIVSQALSREVVHLGNLEARRDFTYVDDTVEGFMKMAEAEGVEGEVINLGTGEDISIGEVAEKIIAMIGRKVRIEVEQERMRPDRSEVMRLVADNRLAREKTGWMPEVKLEEGLRRTIAWIEGHMEYFDPDRYVF